MYRFPCLVLFLLLFPLSLSAQAPFPAKALKNFRLDSFAQQPQLWFAHKEALLQDSTLCEKRFTVWEIDALQIACAVGDVSAVKKCLAAGCSPYRSNKYVPFSLAIALHYNHAALVHYLIEYDTKLASYCSESGYNALFIGPNTSTALIGYLLQKGAAPNNPAGHSPVVLAAAQLPQLQLLLAKGGKVDTQDKEGRRPLHFAAAYAQDTAVLAYLLQAGADLQARSAYAYSPLHYAAHFNKNPAVLHWLLEKGSDVQALDNRRATPLHLAARYNPNPAITQQLLEAGANLQAQDDFGRQALHRTAQFSPNKAEVLPLLLEAGADVHAHNNFKHDVLDLALTRGKPSQKANANDSIGLLILLRAYPHLIHQTDDFGRMPLHQAANRSSPALVRILIEQGAPINARMRNGATPLLRATQNPDLNVLKLLVAEGADLQLRNNFGQSVLHYAAWYDFRPDMLRFLLAQGMDIDIRDNYGNTPFLRAAEDSPSVDLLDFLLQNGADIRARNDNGATALHQLAERSDEESQALIRFLLEKGLGIDFLEARDKWGKTPFLTAATFCRNKATLEFWVAQGVDVFAQTNQGRTALHQLANNHYNNDKAERRIELAQYLIDLGIDKRQKDHSQQTAAELALEWNRPELAAFLGEE